VMIPRVYSVCFYPFFHLSYFPIAVLHHHVISNSNWREILRKRIYSVHDLNLYEIEENKFKEDLSTTLKFRSS
jgi:hypothetical protein